MQVDIVPQNQDLPTMDAFRNYIEAWLNRELTISQLSRFKGKDGRILQDLLRKVKVF
jgi:hypothetical protein